MDVLALVVEASHSDSVGRLSHAKSLREDTLRDAEPLFDHANFNSLLQLIDIKTKKQRSHSESYSQKEKRKGKYVVISSPGDVGTEEIAPVARNLNREEDGWDLV